MSGFVANELSGLSRQWEEKFSLLGAVVLGTHRKTRHQVGSVAAKPTTTTALPPDGSLAMPQKTRPQPHMSRPHSKP